MSFMEVPAPAGIRRRSRAPGRKTGIVSDARYAAGALGRPGADGARASNSRRGLSSSSAAARRCSRRSRATMCSHRTPASEFPVGGVRRLGLDLPVARISELLTRLGFSGFGHWCDAGREGAVVAARCRAQGRSGRGSDAGWRVSTRSRSIRCRVTQRRGCRAC